MSTSTAMERMRICLVGDAATDEATLTAAHSFGVHVIATAAALDILNDNEWKTCFLLAQFEGSLYEVLQKMKHCVLGPAALKQAAEWKYPLKYNPRPIYTYAMQKVVTCVTGIRCKEELANLVKLVHLMSGTIRRDMTSKVTHLITTHCRGSKYQYARTFGLTVVRPDWVYAAWERRTEVHFQPTCEEFSQPHQLKAFEGQKICFFGFAPDDYSHMVDVLKTNGGTPAELDDPECSHVVMPNLGMEVDSETETVVADVLAEREKFAEVVQNKNKEYVHEILGEECPTHTTKYSGNEAAKENYTTDANALGYLRAIKQLPEEIPEEENYLAPSPFSNSGISLLNVPVTPDQLSGSNDSLVDIDDFDVLRYFNDKENVLKRSHDSFDTISQISVDSFTHPSSCKKLKVSRRSSITQPLRRSLSFVAEHTPISKLLRKRRSSYNPNDSIDSMCSVASSNTSFNNPTHPLKEKLQNICKHLTRSMTKKDNSFIDTPPKAKEDLPEFKTPKSNEDVSRTDSPLINPINSPHRCTHIIKSDWFWNTIQNGYANELDYLFSDYLDTIKNKSQISQHDLMPFTTKVDKSANRDDNFPHSTLEPAVSKFSNACDDATPRCPLNTPLEIPRSSLNPISETPTKNSMRFNHFMELLNTESNYVAILDTIWNFFQQPLEERADSGDSLLSRAEVKSIFGNFPLIHKVHKSMLERLQTLHLNWHEDCLIGEVILQHCDDLVKAYPPYVNFYEQMKEVLQQHDKNNPRFHAFLQVNHNRAACGRQSLQDLMIRPVQRLPSVRLLLSDIFKHTAQINPDFTALGNALKTFEEVMQHINEDKRKTESHMAIFDIFNEIQDCPTHLVSARRRFISKCCVRELSHNLSGRGDLLALYLFSDTIEVCKAHKRGFYSTSVAVKAYQHVQLISLQNVRYVIDITDSSCAFALLCRELEADQQHAFLIEDKEIDKLSFLRTLCTQLSEANDRRSDTDAAVPLLYHTSQQLGVDTSVVNFNALSKAFLFAARTRLKVEHTFSFKLRRSASTTLLLPFSCTSTPRSASQTGKMCYASLTNINEVSEEDGIRSCSTKPFSQVA